MTAGAAKATVVIPELADLAHHQLIGTHCALCCRYLGIKARRLGPAQRDRHGQTYQLWACYPTCLPRTVHRRPRPAGGVQADGGPPSSAGGR